MACDRQGQRGALITAREADADPAKRGWVSVMWHDLRMVVARWLVSKAGYDLDAMIQLSESTLYEESIRIAWTIDGRCTLLEWRAAARARRLAVVRIIAAQGRTLLRRKRS